MKKREIGRLVDKYGYTYRMFSDKSWEVSVDGSVLPAMSASMEVLYRNIVSLGGEPFGFREFEDLEARTGCKAIFKKQPFSKRVVY